MKIFAVLVSVWVLLISTISVSVWVSVTGISLLLYHTSDKTYSGLLDWLHFLNKAAIVCQECAVTDNVPLWTEDCTFSVVVRQSLGDQDCTTQYNCCLPSTTDCRRFCLFKFCTVLLQCSWHDSVMLISTLLLTYLLSDTIQQWIAVVQTTRNECLHWYQYCCLYWTMKTAIFTLLLMCCWSEFKYNSALVNLQVAKQWYDYERTTFNFVKKLSEPGFTGITFSNQTDFDENGLIYWIGTNARWVVQYIGSCSFLHCCIPCYHVYVSHSELQKWRSL